MANPLVNMMLFGVVAFASYRRYVEVSYGSVDEAAIVSSATGEAAADAKRATKNIKSNSVLHLNPQAPKSFQDNVANGAQKIENQIVSNKADEGPSPTETLNFDDYCKWYNC